MKKLLFFILLPLIAAASDIVDIHNRWSPQASLKDGAAGNGKRENGIDIINNTNGKGYVLYASRPNDDLPIIPGRSYEAVAELEITPGASGALMISMPGGKRRPFPIKKLTASGMAVIPFTARADETKVRFHIVVRGQGQVKVKKLFLKPGNSAIDIKLTSMKASLKDGAKGNGKLVDGIAELNNENGKGYVLYAAPDKFDLPITPGCSYMVIADLEISGSATGALMVSMPGGKRRPFPIKVLSSSGQAIINFTARDDETKLRPHIVVRGQGKVRVKKIRLLKKEQANPNQKNFNGAEMRRFWNLENPVSIDISGNLLAGKANLRSKVVSGKLNWNAESVKAIELDLAIAPECGSINMIFSGIADGKPYSASLRKTNIPSGKMRTLLFDMARQPQWKGTINQIQFVFDNEMEADFTICGMRALNEANCIPNAAVPGKKELETIRPDADYQLFWRGKTPAEVTVKIFDTDNRLLTVKKLSPGDKKLEFTTPLETVHAVAEYENGQGYPVLLCTRLPIPNAREVKWNASWIWHSYDMYPQGVFRLSREFTLPCKVKRAVVRYNADDRAFYEINGHKFADNNLYEVSEVKNITDMLKAGKNIIHADVSNSSGNGGLLFELYAELENGEIFTLKSDKQWQYSGEGISGQAMEVGIPPQGVWRDRIDCGYIGPEVQANIRNLKESSFEIMPQENCPDFGEIIVRITSDTGEFRQIPAAISPRSGKWQPGKWNRVAFNFNATLTAGMSGKNFTMTIEPGFFRDVNNSKLPLPVKSAVAADFPTVKLVGAGSRPYFEVNGKKLAPFYFDMPFSFINMPVQKAHFVKNAHNAGCNIIRCWYGLREFWKAPGVFDFSTLDYAIAVTRSQMPDAHIIITCRTYMPDWWIDQNPGDRLTWFRNDGRYRNYHQTMSSKKWKEDAQIGIKALIDHLRKSGNAKYVIGIAFADGQTCEWLWPLHPYGGKEKFMFASNAQADKDAYFEFLKAKYGKLPANAAIPLPAAWDARDEGIFLDPVKNREVSDFFDFRNATVAEAIRIFTGLVKKETNGKLLSGAYYGYSMMHSRIFYNFQGCGHMRLNEVAKSKTCDLYFAPTMYGWRFPGNPDALMQPPEAITLHGGIPIAEFDYRTYSEPVAGQFHNGCSDTVEMSLSMLDKGFGLALVRAAGGHWMELHERWFREPLLNKHLSKLLNLYRSLPEKPAGTTPVEVCFVTCERTPLRTANNTGDGVHRAVWAEFIRVMPRTGCAYSQVLLSDFLTPGLVKPHKFYIFANLFELTDEERILIKQRLKKENADALWLYAPGVLRPGKKVDITGITEMTGIAVKRTEGYIPIAWESEKEFGGKVRIAHLTTGLNFMPKSGFDFVVARSNGLPSAVCRIDGTRRDYFSAALVPEDKAMQIMLKKAGVHLYQNGSDMMHIGNDFVIIHTVSGGRKELILPNGTKARQILGPEEKFDPAKPAWDARPGRTYGFMLVK